MVEWRHGPWLVAEEELDTDKLDARIGAGMVGERCGVATGC